MKLLIDIPEKYYGACKDAVEEPYPSQIEEVIANGIPYEPKGDLISRSDALKAVDNRHEELLHDTVYLSKDCQIDLLGVKKHILAIPSADTIVNTTEVRPQGEWIDTGDMQEYWAEEYQCSICGAKDHWHNFCPNCGAQMKGGAE